MRLRIGTRGSPLALAQSRGVAASLEALGAVVDVVPIRTSGDRLAQVALAVGASVAISGTVGFVGLIAPHIVRLLLGPAHRTLLPAAALFGGAFLVLADALARTIVSPAELPIGVLTALVGGPFFLWLLACRASREGL